MIITHQDGQLEQVQTHVLAVVVAVLAVGVPAD
jgi:hypothetical protein